MRGDPAAGLVRPEQFDIELGFNLDAVVTDRAAAGGRCPGERVDRGAPKWNEDRLKREANSRDLRGHIEREDPLEDRFPRHSLDLSSNLDPRPAEQVFGRECRLNFRLRRAEKRARAASLRGSRRRQGNVRYEHRDGDDRAVGRLTVAPFLISALHCLDGPSRS